MQQQDESRQLWDEVSCWRPSASGPRAGSNHDTEVKRRELQALVFASRGEHEAAQALANEAVERGEQSQHFDTHAEPFVTQAEVLRQQRLLALPGPPPTGMRRYQAKGDLRSVARVGQLLADLEG